MEARLYNRVIGIDVHQATLVCARTWIDDNEVLCETKTFKTFKSGRREMAAWRAAFNPDLVIMESTGIYWKSPYAALEEVGIMAAVVNARDIKKLEGRKTDMGDAQWLAHVGRLGMFTRSFVIDQPWRDLRTPAREILKLNGMLSSEKNRLCKVFTDAGFRLNVVFSDVFGINGQIAVRALLEGASPEQVVHTIDVQRFKASREEILDALNGKLSQHHKFTAEKILDHIDYLSSQIASYSDYLYKEVEQRCPHLIAQLTTMPGASNQSVVRVLVELNGGDLSSFSSADKLSSWLGFCPGNNESGGKKKVVEPAKGANT
jgi:transposase